MYNGGQIESHYGLSNDAIFNDFERPDFNVVPLFNAEYLRNATRYRHSFNGIFQWNRDLHTTYLRMSFRMILSDLE